jgi:hypothetical protein
VFAHFRSLGWGRFVISDRGELHSGSLDLVFCCIKECVLGRWMMGTLIALASRGISIVWECYWLRSSVRMALQWKVWETIVEATHVRAMFERFGCISGSREFSVGSG